MAVRVRQARHPLEAPRPALVAVACGLVAVGFAACGSDDDPPTEPLVITTTTTDTTTTTTTDTTTTTETGTGGVKAGPSAEPPGSRTSLALEHPGDAYPVVWVRKGREVEIRTEPGGGEVVETVDKRTEFSSPTVFGVVRRSGHWAGVTTPYLPNNELGWIKLDPVALNAGWTRLSIVVDVSERRAVLRAADKLVRSFAVTVGMPGADTPTGRFAVTDTFRGDLNPAYGCCALALSATQPSLPSGWLGGNRIAIHGTSGPLGIAASHGCVRAADPDVSKLVDRVPLGAPVFIRA